MARAARGNRPTESVREPASPSPAGEQMDAAEAGVARAGEVAHAEADAGTSIARRDLEPGRRLADFRILSPMEQARDDFGPDRTYIAEDEVAGGLVMLQVVPAHGVDRGMRARFMDGARQLSALARRHSGVALPRRFGEQDGWLYLASPYPAAADLGDHLARSGPLSPAAALRILRPVAEAVDAAHRRGIVHRDVRPANILLSDDGRVFLANFPVWERRFDGDGRADVQAFGRVLFACLTGIQPAHDDLAPRLPLRPPDLAPEIDVVLRRVLAVEPGAGYSSCVALLDAFARAAGTPRHGASRPRSRATPREAPAGASALGAVGLAMAAALGVVGMTLAAGLWPGSPAPAAQTPAARTAEPRPSMPPTTAPAGSAPAVAPPPASASASPVPSVASPVPSVAAPTVRPSSALPVISVGDAQLVSGTQSTLDFTVFLSHPTIAVVTIAYETLDGTAVAGEDYTSASGTLEIPAGQASATVTVAIAAAGTDEADESFSLRVLGATNALIADATGTGLIVAAAPNRPPTCEPRTISVAAGGSTQLNPRCADPDGDVLSFEIVDRPVTGVVRIAGGKIRFEARNGARRTDSFTYRATDGELSSEPTRITVTISGSRPTNRAPRCQALELRVKPGGSASVRPRCSDPDGDTLTFRIRSQGNKGTATVTDNGRLRYVADDGKAGRDVFTYAAHDGSRGSVAVTVVVTIGQQAPPGP